MQRPFVVNLVSHKGGGGRTTVAVSLAEILAVQGKNVLLIDMDFEAPGIPLFTNRWNTEKLKSIMDFQPENLVCIADISPAKPGQKPISEKNNVGSTRCRIPGSVDCLQMTLEHIREGLPDISDANIKWNQSVVSDILQTFRENDSIGKIEVQVQKQMRDYIYEYIPNSKKEISGSQPTKLPARIFLLPSGGCYFRKSKETIRWEYSGTNYYILDSMSSDETARSKIAQPWLPREFVFNGVNLTATLVNAAVYQLDKINASVDYVIIDLRPGDDVVTGANFSASDGVTYTSAASRGAMNGIIEDIKIHKDAYLPQKEGERNDRVPKIFGCFIDKLSFEARKDSRNYAQENVDDLGYPDVFDIVSEKDDCLKNIGKIDSIGRTMQVACHHAYGTLNQIPLFPWNNADTKDKAFDVVGSVDTIWSTLGLKKFRPASLLPLPLDNYTLTVQERTFELTDWSKRVAFWSDNSVLQNDPIGAGANCIALVSAEYRDSFSDPQTVPIRYFQGDFKGDWIWRMANALGLKCTDGNESGDTAKKIMSVLDKAPQSIKELDGELSSGAVLDSYYFVLGKLVNLIAQDSNEKSEYETILQLCDAAISAFECRESHLKYDGLKINLKILQANTYFKLATIEFDLYELNNARDHFKRGLKLFTEVREISNTSGDSLLKLDADKYENLRKDADTENVLFFLNYFITENEAKATELMGKTDNSLVISLVDWFEPLLKLWSKPDSVPKRLEIWIEDYNLSDIAFFLAATGSTPLKNLSDKLFKALTSALDNNWATLQFSIRAHMLPCYLHNAWAGLAFSRDKPNDVLSRRLDDIYRQTNAFGGLKNRAKLQNWAGIANLELAKVMFLDNSIDAATEFSRRAASLLLRSAINDHDISAWFLLAIARTVTRRCLEERVGNSADSKDKEILLKRILIVRRDAFYAYEQWHALASADVTRDDNQDHFNPEKCTMKFLDEGKAKSNKTALALFGEDVEVQDDTNLGMDNDKTVMIRPGLISTIGGLDRYYQGSEAGELDEKLSEYLIQVLDGSGNEHWNRNTALGYAKEVKGHLKVYLKLGLEKDGE